MKLSNRLCMLAVAIGMAGTGCQKFIDVNTNPNLATVTSPVLVFTNAQNVYAASFATDGNIMGSFWGGYWAHSTSFTTGNNFKTYDFTNGDFNYWGNILDNIYDFQYVINNADKEKVPYLKGPSKVVKALRYQELVDLYGNAPYSEAFKGIDVFQPRYDKAEDIYDSLVILLDDAIADLKAHDFPGTFAANIYSIGEGHSREDWIRFANTAKLRILMRQSLLPARQQYIRAEIEQILAEGSGFLGEDQTVFSQPGYTKSLGKLNPFYLLVGFDHNDAATSGRDMYRISQYLIDTLKDTDDTIRMKYIAAPRPNAVPDNAPAFYLGNVAHYTGIPFGGEGGNYLTAATSPIGPGRVVRSASNEASVIFTAAESFFLRAEAALRFGIAGLGDPKELYQKGVRESFKLLGATVANADLLLAGSADYDAAPDKAEAILYQKWVALANFNGQEAWSEFRRNDFPKVPMSVNSGALSSRPVRLYYPQDEVSTNGENVAAQGEIDVYTGRLFWDVR